ncbi:MAG: AAA family ATPase [Saprospiraceae bacterium]|nr:AAA family ATPase [Saprospiraceae bacterium]
MLYKRTLSKSLRELSVYYPIISLIGPRQAGKSTLLKSTFSDYTYVSLEDPDVLAIAEQDPRGFLERYNNKVIFDEAQKFPELFSYMQSNVDNNRSPARFILSGSQNFLLHKNISQSLAGREGMLTLYPFDFNELIGTELWSGDIIQTVINGFYPGKLIAKIPSHLFYQNYLAI